MELSADFIMLLVWDWLEFAVRWLHVITAIAWIGSSFYFIALDLGLRRDRQLPDGVNGEEWQVHGGGFYHIQKYLVAPSALPEHLTWFKWESYATWLSGFVLLVLVYYLGADLYLLDQHKMEMPVWAGILISLASLGLGWLGYNALCKSSIGQHSTGLMILLYLLLVCLSWGFAQIFTGRAAFIHLGAITATIMSANVFMVIIPNQKIVVADLKAGRTPDAKYGQIAKQRSTHNNYLTLPVIFLMLSGHYPLAFATDYSWIIASLVFLMGVSIRHYFNSLHARKGKPGWTWAITAALFAAIMALSVAPLFKQAEPASEVALNSLSGGLSGPAGQLASHPDFEMVSEIVQGRCAMCHAAEPYFDNIAMAPKGVLLETPAQIAMQARAIFLQSAVSHAMPPANISWMEAEERALIARWYQAALQGS